MSARAIRVSLLKSEQFPGSELRRKRRWTVFVQLEVPLSKSIDRVHSNEAFSQLDFDNLIVIFYC